MIQQAITRDNYHRSKSAVSRSELVDLMQSPRVFEAKHINGSWEEEDSSALVIGSIVHEILLLNHDRRLRRPEQFADYRTKAAQEWKREAIAAGYVTLTDTEYRQVEFALRSLRKGLAQIGNPHQHPDAIIETPIVWEHVTDDGETILCRCMPDILIPLVDRYLGFDIKTILHCTPDEIRKSSREHRYDIQKVHYWEGIESLGMPCDSFTFIYGEKSQPVRPAATQTIGPERTAEAIIERREALKELSRRMAMHEKGDPLAWADPWESDVIVSEFNPKWI